MKVDTFFVPSLKDSELRYATFSKPILKPASGGIPLDRDGDDWKACQSYLAAVISGASVWIK